jgi:hypothetical protein
MKKADGWIVLIAVFVWFTIAAANHAPVATPSPSPSPTPIPATGIQVTNATYGDNVGAKPNSVASYVAAACDGKTNCAYKIDYRSFSAAFPPSGDPAPGRAKDFAVTYRCNNAYTLTAKADAEANGKTITLACPPPPQPLTCTLNGKTLICTLP